jgi:hypothetical protein
MNSVIISREQIENLKVGDIMPNNYGFMKEVVEIRCKGLADNGKYFASFLLQFGPDSTTINTIWEGQTMVNPR